MKRMTAWRCCTLLVVLREYVSARQNACARKKKEKEADMNIRSLMTTTLAIFLLSASAAAQRRALPLFKDYPATKFTGKPAPVKLTSPRARKYRTGLRENATEGPNFAGHYTIAAFGCGTGCVSPLAIIDATTGDVYFPPSVATIASLPDAEDEEMIQSRADSRLLVVVGEVNEKKGKYYFEWANNRLRLIRAIAKE